ncbi:MBL fold metallo-hydrolase [Reichenbachiella sp. MALMAid0571]|uniref:MBL fold metallo-hydrolase n=1 Tax=Reichenbachiella sp. MALMAid0571 TaxID=3143939 RepID=UPI0032DF4B93
MKATFLGTGTSQGVPVIACDCPVCQSIDFRDKRLRSAIHIETEDLSIVVDTGPDFRQQMIRERIKRLDAILFTHEHKDHTAGLDDIRGFNFRQKGDIPIYGHQRVLDQLKKEFSYIFAEEKYPGGPRIEINSIENETFKIGNTNITPIEVMHYKLPVFGFRIGDFAYITDAKYINEPEKEKLRGVKIMVLNALQKKPHISHLTLEESIELATEIDAKQTYLTHVSHNLGCHRNVSKELPRNIQLAYDGLKISC